MDRETKDIRNQVEFYFSDANVVRDKFLRNQIAANDGWVSISLVNSFNRMKAFGKHDKEIEGILKESEVLETKGGKVRRKSSLPENGPEPERTLLVRNLDREMTLDDIKKVFAEVLEKIERIGMRRDKDKNFKGSAFIDVVSKEAAEEIKNRTFTVEEEIREDNKKIKRELVLEVLHAFEYFEGKKAAAKKTKEEKKEKEKREIVDSFRGKIFWFKFLEDPKEEAKISDFKKAIDSCAFVDMDKKCFRLKEQREFDGKIEVSGAPLSVKKMTDKEVEAYCKDLALERGASKRHRKK
jgi:La domain/RNA recognition motif. (a.k.a. RRM, RBD, or RNP domain)